MSRKGGSKLNDFKLHYERLPSEPPYKKKTNDKSKHKTNNAKEFLDNHLLFGLALYFPIVFQSRKATHRTAVLSNVDDRKNMPKVPQAKKAVRKSKAKRPL